MIYVLGGTSLNFKIAGGTTPPASPAENTIWVNTSTTISEWVFSAEQPTNPVAGMVWFQTGSAATAPFNALKKNNVTIYPTGCRQYVSGAWVSKTAKTYQGGKWTEWYTLLYFFGNQNTAITGGWEISNSAKGTAILSTNSIDIDITGDSDSGDDDTCCICTKNKVDVSEYKILRINPEWQTGGSEQRWTTFGLFHEKPKSFTTSNDSVAGIFLDKNQSAANVFSIDISSVSGSYYVAYRCCFYDSESYYAKGKITEVALEK